jgi:hypothetical protein
MDYTQIAEKLYPRADVSFSYPKYDISSYQPIINEFFSENTPRIRISDNNWSGDDYVFGVTRSTSEYAFLVFGWGSCSGCDELQGCDNYEELGELIKKLHSKIVRFSTFSDLKTYVETNDWEKDYFAHETNGKRFIALLKAFISEEE